MMSIIWPLSLYFVSSDAFALLRRGVLLYRARQMASRMVVLPLPVSPQIRKTGALRRGSAVKSICASEIDAILLIVSFLSFMASCFALLCL